MKKQQEIFCRRSTKGCNYRLLAFLQFAYVHYSQPRQNAVHWNSFKLNKNSRSNANSNIVFGLNPPGHFPVQVQVRAIQESDRSNTNVHEFCTGETPSGLFSSLRLLKVTLNIYNMALSFVYVFLLVKFLVLFSLAEKPVQILRVSVLANYEITAIVDE